MVVSVAPLVHLPMHLHIFDYTVPVHQRSLIRVGQFIRIPFRKKEVFGIVVRIHDAQLDTTTTKEIISILSEVPFLTPSHLKLYLILSDWYGTSLSTLLRMALLPIQKRKIANVKDTFPPLVSQNTDANRLHFKHPLIRHYSTAIEHRKILQSCIQGNTLILVPEKHLIHEVYALLTDEQQSSAICWHSDLSQKQQFELWIQIRNNNAPIVIGTRSAALLPFSSLQTVIVDYEEREHHKHIEQAPRFHVKDVLSLFHDLYGTTTFYTSFSPSLSSYYDAYKGPISSRTTLTLSPIHESVRVINMDHERRGGNYEAFSEALLEALHESTKDIFLFVPRLGDATSLYCVQCSTVSRCGACTTPLVVYEHNNILRCHFCQTSVQLHTLCPQCQSTNLKPLGFGTHYVYKQLLQLFPKEAAHIIQLDSTNTDIVFPQHGRRIIVGTEKAFSYIRWEDTDLIAFVSVDEQLAMPSSGSHVHIWHTIMQGWYYKQPSSTYMIQTKDPHHIVFRSFKEPDRFYRTELQARSSIFYPPYTYMVRYMYGHRNKHDAKRYLQHVYESLQKRLTMEQKNITLSSPIEMQPSYFRGKYWVVIIAKYSKETWQADMLWLHQFLPSPIKIDPRPLSLLSP